MTIERLSVIGIVVLFVGSLAYLWVHQPDPTTWPQCEYFRCRICKGPVSIDPEQPERWGCPSCATHTLHLFNSFYTATRADLTTEELGEAERIAGVITPANSGPTLMDFYHNSH